MLFRFQKKKEEGTFVEHKIYLTRERKKASMIFFGLTAILGWLYVFFFSEIFTVQTIQVDGVASEEEGRVRESVMEKVRNQRFWPFREGNIILLNTQPLKISLIDELFAKTVTVDKKYPNILRLKVEERQASLIIVYDNRYYEIDRYGFVRRELGIDEVNQINEQLSTSSYSLKTQAPILHLETSPGMVIGNEYISEYRMRSWLDTFGKLGDLGFGYKNAILSTPTSSKLTIDMYEPYDVYFDILEPIEPQIQSFYAFMKSKEQIEKVKEYVDARIPGKIYFK